MSQTRTYQLEGRNREEQVGKLGNVAQHKQGLTCWRGGRGRSRLVSLETWHDLCVAGTSVKLSCKKKSTKNHSRNLDDAMQRGLAAWLGTSALKNTQCYL